MAGVKLVVIYPRPKDIEVFEKLYQEEHVPMAVDKLAGKTKFIATKIVATPDGHPSLLPNRRGLFPIPGSIASVCAVRRWQRNRRPCRQNLEWWHPDIPGCRRANAHVWEWLKAVVVP
jgi:hypothetical protein